MKMFYKELESSPKSNAPNYLTLTTDSEDNDEAVLNYFIGFWLKNMGYGYK